jgi:hypothetical protein
MTIPRPRHVLLYCGQCSFMGKAVVNDRHKTLVRMTMGFVATKDEHTGLHFHCVKCDAVVAGSDGL